MSVGARFRALPALPVRPLPSNGEPPAPRITGVVDEWDDHDDEAGSVDFQDDTLDDTVKVAAQAVEAAAAAEKQGMMTEGQRNGEGGGAGVMIRVASTGAIVSNKGGSDDLAGVVAYAHRLIELVGDMLGLERFVALDCVFKSGNGPPGGERSLLFVEGNGDTVLVRQRWDEHYQALRERLGLG